MHLVSYYFTMSFPWRGSAVAGSSGAGEGVPPDGLPRNRIARRSRRKPTSNRTKQAARRWEGIKEQVGIRWTRLTAADLDTVGGNLERLLDLLRLRYGYDRRAAEEQIGSWSRSLPRASWARQSPGAPRVRARSGVGPRWQRYAAGADACGLAAVDDAPRRAGHTRHVVRPAILTHRDRARVDGDAVKLRRPNAAAAAFRVGDGDAAAGAAAPPVDRVAGPHRRECRG